MAIDTFGKCAQCGKQTQCFIFGRWLCPQHWQEFKLKKLNKQEEKWHTKKSALNFGDLKKKTIQ